MSDPSPGIPDAWICTANPNFQVNTNMSIVRFRGADGYWTTMCFRDYFTEVGHFSPHFQENRALPTTVYVHKTNDLIDTIAYRSDNLYLMVIDSIEYNTNSQRFSNNVVTRLFPEARTVDLPRPSLDNYSTYKQIGPDVIEAGVKIKMNYQTAKPVLTETVFPGIILDYTLGFIYDIDIQKIYPIEDYLYIFTGLTNEEFVYVPIAMKARFTDPAPGREDCFNCVFVMTHADLHANKYLNYIIMKYNYLYLRQPNFWMYSLQLVWDTEQVSTVDQYLSPLDNMIAEPVFNGLTNYLHDKLLLAYPTWPKDKKRYEFTNIESAQVSRYRRQNAEIYDFY